MSEYTARKWVKNEYIFLLSVVDALTSILIHLDLCSLDCCLAFSWNPTRKRYIALYICILVTNYGKDYPYAHSSATRKSTVMQKQLNDRVGLEYNTNSGSIVWRNLNLNETWFLAWIFPKLESTECRDFRHKYLGFHVIEAGRRTTYRSRNFLAKCDMSRGDCWEKLPALSNFIVRPSAAEPKSLKTPKNNSRKHSDSVILYWSTCVGNFEGHLAYLGEISEQRSLIREIDRDQPEWRIYVGGLPVVNRKIEAQCKMRSKALAE